MGAIGGPNISPPTANSTGGNNDFGGKPVDAVFKYAGAYGDGDPGIIDPPTNVYRMTKDLTQVSQINQRPARVVMVEYTAEMSNGESVSDFTNGPAGSNPHKPQASYIMARHFATLAADTMMMEYFPVQYNGNKYYGSLIISPDLLGQIQQFNFIGKANAALPAGRVTQAVEQALCLLTNNRRYTNTYDPNGVQAAPYLGKTYTGNAVQILKAMLDDGYPAWSIEGQDDAYWNINMGNVRLKAGTLSQVGAWFNDCVTNPVYDKNIYSPPRFPAGFEGWVQANNWLIRTFSPRGNVTFGWQNNMWAVSTGYWLHKDLSTQDIVNTFSLPMAQWLQTNAPSTVSGSDVLSPDFFVFDRYEMDDSAAPGFATLYNARSWDNYLAAVGQFSKLVKNIPIMLWQIPGSHLPYRGEANPPLLNGTPNSYVFSTAPVYFFGDENLASDLSNLIMGSPSSNTNTAVGATIMDCGQNRYNCLTPNSNYRSYLLEYKGAPNNFNWSKDNGKLQMAVQNNVFSILWGGGNTTNVIKNFSNPNDNGWLSRKLIKYYQAPTPANQ